jgi:nitroimidazol reductase NimA-like FMN-containing flavoprotein (pyridoxamine 5'-phosphate oxidase superfamily)
MGCSNLESLLKIVILGDAMRRTDREIQSREAIDQIIQAAGVFHLGLSQADSPYVVPLSFGYDGKSVYFHTADEGMKIDYMTANPRVCFEMEQAVHIIRDEQACKWGQAFNSVIGFGMVHEITDEPGRKAAMQQVMLHYSGKEWEFDAETFSKIRLWCISIDQVTGKRRGE